MSKLAQEDRTILAAAVRCAELETANRQYIAYIREKTNQLLRVMGTEELRHDELDDRDLLTLDPIGIVADSIAQVIDSLENRQATAPKSESQHYIRYIREKTNQLLRVMGSEDLRYEELDDRDLLVLDPIGIVAGSIAQVINHLEENKRIPVE